MAEKDGFFFFQIDDAVNSSTSKKKEKDRLKIGDTVYFVTEHYYYIPDKAGARMEYMPVKGTVTEIIVGGFRQAKIQSIVDGIVKLHYFKTSEYGKGFYPDYDSALQAAKRAADKYDRIWSGITGEEIRRPWEKEKAEKEKKDDVNEQPMQEMRTEAYRSAEH